MGKGDKKSKKGKISMGSFGVSRPRTKAPVAAPKAEKAVKAEKAAPKAKKAPAKKAKEE